MVGKKGKILARIHQADLIRGKKIRELNLITNFVTNVNYYSVFFLSSDVAVK